MGLRFFAVRITNSEASALELNGFLTCHKVSSIQRKLIVVGVNSFCAIGVDCLSNASDAGASSANLSRSRVHYKAILPPEEFAVYSQLRDNRKELAQTEAVPVYALFTNERLAQMVQRRCRSKCDLTNRRDRRKQDREICRWSIASFVDSEDYLTSA
jgi:superfamily II DNA helicase RecQ